MKNIASDAAIVLDGKAAEMAKMQELQEKLNCRAVITEHSAGWKASLLEPRTRNEYEKIFSSDGNQVLFLPTKNNCGGFNGISMPLMLSREKGIADKPDSALYTQDYAPRITQLPDSSRSYITNGLSSHIRSYDENLKPLADVDLTAINPELSRINDFHCGTQAHYARALSPQQVKETREYVVALDPTTCQPRWTREIECHCGKGIFEAPDGAVYVSSRKNENYCLLVFSKDGKEKGAIELGGIPEAVAFGRDGSVIVSGSGIGMKAIRPAKLLPGRYSTKWHDTTREFSTFTPSKDGRSLFAMDNSNSRNRLARIDVDTGKPLWEQSDPSSHLLDFRVINEEIYTLAESGDTKSAVMTRFDCDGKILWRDTVPAGGLDRWHGGSITPKGDFVFESKDDGSLHFLHPRKEGETKETLQLGLINTEDVMEAFRDRLAEERENPGPQGSGVEDTEHFVIIDDLKLEKKS